MGPNVSGKPVNNSNSVPHVELEGRKYAMTGNKMEIRTQKESEENPEGLMDVCVEALSSGQYGFDTKPTGHTKSWRERKLVRAKNTKTFKRASPILGSKITPL